MATLGEVLLAMVGRGIHHLPLVREGQLVSMVTDTDLLRHEWRHPLFVRRQLDRATARRTCRLCPRRWPRRRSA